jgi:predicted amidohydrolase YtcJ
MQQARNANEAIAVHMIGDGAAEQVISMVEKYPPPNSKRDRLIHCCLLTEEQIERMRKLNIILDIQPSFVPSDFPWVEEKLGKHRLPFAYAWKSLSAFPCALGTDAPIEDVNPFHTIYAAVTRKKVGGKKVFNASECLSPFEAIKMYTYGSAYAIGKESERGLIREGYLADFTIVDQDLFTISPDQILETSVIQTIVDGRTVYKNKQTN